MDFFILGSRDVKFNSEYAIFNSVYLSKRKDVILRGRWYIARKRLFGPYFLITLKHIDVVQFVGFYSLNQMHEIVSGEGR